LDQSQGSAFFSQGSALLGRALLLIILLLQAGLRLSRGHVRV